MKTKKTYVKPEILVEEWKVYKITGGYRSNPRRVYEVSNFGRVMVNGVLVDIPNNHERVSIAGFYVHRAVAELFIPNPENKPCVDHIDTNPSNNMVWNLRWVTYKENNNNPLTRQHMSEAAKRKKVSEETKQKQRGKTPWNKGKTGIYSKETLEMMSKSHIGKTPWNKGIKQKKTVSK